MKVYLLLLLCALEAYGDIYMHNPRGSNNRLNEPSRNRRNGNRLFDSQNNNRGGYNVGAPMYYYSGSKLPIQWTNQHSCNSPNANCNIVIQYMCGANVRDGTTLGSIAVNRANNKAFGMHEDVKNYLNCRARLRNKGLFTADQNLGNNKYRSIYTRQNPGGTRRAFECPEERDYYPYWGSSPWKDIAVLTNDVSQCNDYKSESQNVKSRFACVVSDANLLKYGNQKLQLPITKAECDTYRWPSKGRVRVTAQWTELPSHNIPAPDCTQTSFNRDNHHGNTFGGNMNMYNWTLPQVDTEQTCVMRMRYNISTADYDPAATNSAHNTEADGVDMAEAYGFESQDEAEDRGYIFENDPEVKVFPGVEMSLQLAINTAQFGRTFQDRSHVFKIKPRPTNLGNAVIHNVNVRGKRGNIVQVYPAVEYDFVPETLHMEQGDYVHFQWTGSDTNPKNNDGEGKKGQDRSNVVLMAPKRYDEGTQNPYAPLTTYGHLGRSYPNGANNYTFMGIPTNNLKKLANEALKNRYFDLTPQKITEAGAYNYMCTRNNNFSNRSQKGRIFVSGSARTAKREEEDEDEENRLETLLRKLKDSGLYKRMLKAEAA